MKTANHLPTENQAAKNKSESKYFNTALRMDEALLRLLEKKDFEFITVKEICAAAKVNRSTFYLHYENTYELLAESIETLTSRFFSSFAGDAKRNFTEKIAALPEEKLYLVTDEYLLPYLAFVKQNKTAFRAMRLRPDLFNAENTYREMFDTIFSPILSRFNVPAEEHAYRMEFYAKGLSAVVMRWVASDCQDPQEKIAEIIKACAFMPPRSHSAAVQ